MPTHAQRQVIVTGGGTGIGRAIAQAFAADGAYVILLGRRLQALEQATAEMRTQQPNATVSWQRCDISSVEDVEAFVRWLVSAGDATIDVLVNNAGGVEVIANDAPLAEMAAYARHLLANNLIGTYLMTQVLKSHLRRPGGRVINISSIAAIRGGGDMYSAAKAGVIGLTYALAGELAAEGITVNAVAPGFIMETEFFGERMTEEGVRRRVAQIPMGRPGHPADIAAAVRYLASEEASYVTGEVHHVNGGWVFGR